MRNLVAGLIAFLLLIFAIRLLRALKFYQWQRQRAIESELALGRRIIVEIPAGDGLVLFTEDDVRFYYGERSIDKDLIRGVRLLVNGSSIATAVSSRFPAGATRPAEAPSVHESPDGIIRDRWDVAVDAGAQTVLIECGAIRDRVSQELAGKIFNALKSGLERRNA